MTTSAAPFATMESLTIFDVAQLEARFLQVTQETQNLVLDGSAIAEIDGAGLQWLLAGAQRLQACGGSLIVSSPSAMMTEALTLSGLLSLTGASDD